MDYKTLVKCWENWYDTAGIKRTDQILDKD